jgi:hypothetical protein
MLDFLVLEYRNIIKSLVWIFIPLALIMCLWSGAVTLSMNYAESIDQQAPAPIINMNATLTPTPAAPAAPVDVITVDSDALKRNVQYPTQFTRTEKDPTGAYYNMSLNFGTGPFPGVYIVYDKWAKAGGRIVHVNAMPTSAFYYTVFTNKGTSNQVIYDRQKNVVYSMVKDPEIFS